ncbi:hypothetical protein CGCSCA4_v012849 [Colletotrichum siamense]|uniref:Uncharacterized protein n=1 Tax=Colletotrichum siamense TaxID=690259 RepID=A0A9P5BQD3_COLSI|nr:hypothetical protein CGCSCA4_v012849 [Colletotrichum siamense]KAF4848202.1 hypothetical protein CGCSCA2_v012405 [Colletotrichum siamense]
MSFAVDPHHLSLMAKSMTIEGFSFTSHLETAHKNLPQHLIETGHRPMFRFIYLDPARRPFITKKTKVAARVTAIVRAALMVASVNDLGPQHIEKALFWDWVKDMLVSDDIFESATAEETLEWKFIVELFYAAWVEFAKSRPYDTKRFVAVPDKDDYNFWDLHLAMADWDHLMGGNFGANADMKGFRIIEDRERKEASSKYYFKMDGSNRARDASLGHWSSGWSMCMQKMIERADGVLEREQEMMRLSAMDNMDRDRRIGEKTSQIEELDREIDELKARLAKYEEMSAHETAGATSLGDEAVSNNEVVTSSVVNLADHKIKNGEGYADENHATTEAENTADQDRVAKQGPETMNADKDAAIEVKAMATNYGQTAAIDESTVDKPTVDKPTVDKPAIDTAPSSLDKGSSMPGPATKTSNDSKSIEVIDLTAD